MSVLVWAGVDDWRAEWAAVDTSVDWFTARGVQLGLAPLPYRVDYRLFTTSDWVTDFLEVDAAGDGWKRSIRLARASDGWWSCEANVEGAAQLPDPGIHGVALTGALDCDLGFSPLTNTMPMLRHRLHEEAGDVTLTMAWVSVPDLAVHASSQRYQQVRSGPPGAVVRYSDDGFTADLTVDTDGFVIDYPDLAKRVAF